ncbi:MAG: tetratricopeptide repeat protein, partial [Bacteroidales bacterium]|nr:tetratricopeptide repeat protein [Bacteroidales bacterium]
ISLPNIPASVKCQRGQQIPVRGILSTRNYRLAYESLQKITVKDDNYNRAMQQISFYRALEHYNNLEFEACIERLNESLKYSGFNQQIEVRSHYWLGEAYYRINNYDRAGNNYQKFLTMPGAYNLGEFPTAHYNLGYTWFKRKEYEQSAIWFRKFIGLKGKKDAEMLADAYNRAGDALFIQKKYNQAADYYHQAYQLGLIDADYALYQEAIAKGVLYNYQEKINCLNLLIATYPKSTYLDDAIFELGNTYVLTEKPAQAMEHFSDLANNFPNSSYRKKALTNLGLLQYNAGNNQDALKQYHAVVEDYPGTDEAQNALLGLKNIYLDMDKVDSYLAYVKTLGGFADVSVSEKDSLLYRAAENLYMTGDCDASIKRLDQYLSQFPDGAFSLNAWFYIGDCHYLKKEYNTALEAFQHIADKPKNTFTEQSLLGTARIYTIQEKYTDALLAYTQLERVAELKANLLEARIGALRCNYSLKHYQNTIDAATSLLITDKVSEELAHEAYFKRAKSFQAINDNNNALNDYMQLSNNVKSRDGAESKYRVAQIFASQKKNDKAEAEIFDFIEQNTPHQYWMAKSFMLLANIYLENENYFQASQTLQSIIDYYEDPNDGIIEEANQLLKKTETLEGRQNQSPALKEMEINVENN